MTIDIVTKVFTLTSLAFLFALIVTPLWTGVLYRYKLGKNIRDDGSTPIFTKLHAGKLGTPTMGGVLVWGSTLLMAALFWVLDRLCGLDFFHPFNFLTRKESIPSMGQVSYP